MEFSFWEELFVILYFLSLFILSYMIIYDIFVFFYFIQKKYIPIKYFFSINVPINYPPLSKIIQKFPKVVQPIPKNSEKSRKIPKKSDFSRFFLMLSTAFLSKVVAQFIIWNCEKNVWKKSRKKSGFHFCKLFF